jgi:SCY1-like protein 1
MFTAWRRLGNPNHRPRLKIDGFLELGMGPAATGGWWPSNRLVKLSTALEGFSLASESERSGLIRTLKTVDSQTGSSLPEDFLKYKVLPSLVRAFEFGGGGPTLLPLILSLAAPLPPDEYSTSIIQPLIRMFATPDRAMRMALLEGLDKFADKLTNKEVSDRIWPHLVRCLLILHYSLRRDNLLIPRVANWIRRCRSSNSRSNSQINSPHRPKSDLSFLLVLYLLPTNYDSIL